MFDKGILLKLKKQCNGFQWWQVDKISPIKLYDENKCIAGFQLRNLIFKQGQHQYARSVMEKLFRFYNEGKIRPVIDSAWAIEDVSQLQIRYY